MIYIIVNKTAQTGKGAYVWPIVKEVLETEEVTYKAFQTKYKGHAAKLARQISLLPDNDIKLVVLGGDGTVNEVINGICDFSKVRLGIIPTGSGNDFARGMGISNDIVLNMRRIIYSGSCGDTIVDLGLVKWEGCKNPRYFAISSGFGLDAIVCKKALTSKLKKVLNRYNLGKLTYLILTIETLFSMTTVKAAAEIDNGKHVRYDNLIFSAAMNLKAEGGGVPMAPKACFDDGKMSMCTAHGIPKYLTFLALPFLVAAKHEKLRCFDLRTFKKCDISLSGRMTLHADGEYCGEVKKVHFECVPQVLHLINSEPVK